MLESIKLDPLQLVLGGASLLVLSCYIFRRRDLDHIPTIGYADPFLSIISSIRYLTRGRDIAEEGYKKASDCQTLRSWNAEHRLKAIQYPNHMFKISTFDGWNVIVNGRDKIDDMRRATNEQLSSIKSTEELFQLKHTIGERISSNPYHNEVIRSAMTRNIENRYHEIYDEVVQVYSDFIRGKEDGEHPYQLGQVKVASRVNARYFFGKPLSDDPKFLSTCERATEEIFKGRFTRYFSEFMRPLLGRLLTDASALRENMKRHLKPIIEYRLEQENIHGLNWSDKPNDLISWLMDGLRASGDPVTVEDICARVLLISFGAIHTMSASVTAALYALCLNPDVVGELREEIETVVEEEGWSKASLDKMRKVDSFLRESQRLNFMFHFTMTRTTMKPMTFSDGTVLPRDTFVSVNLHSRHRDNKTYPDANVFKSFRFVRDADTGGPRQSLVNPTLDYLPFGHGRPACPGRFYAVAELKTIFAHVVTAYDLKLEKDEYPTPIYMEANAFPNAEAKILFRKRRR